MSAGRQAGPEYLTTGRFDPPPALADPSEGDDQSEGLDQSGMAGGLDPVTVAPALTVRRLWLAVIGAALDDAFGAGTKATPLDRWTARLWFGSGDFVTVCDMAGIDPGVVQRHARRLARQAGARA